ncbi:MAG: glycosyltransferase, partial [Bryobacteraceae bacterium]|nr:glycosyltransferase [Bryobacteraceae bacterium]
MILLSAALFFLALTIANVLFWPGFGKRRPHPATSLTVAIPARDEELNIGACLDEVLAQGAVVSEVIVCNDGST